MAWMFSSTGNKQQTKMQPESVGPLRKMAVLVSLTVLVYYVDTRLQKMSGETSNNSFLADILTVMFCMLLPAFFLYMDCQRRKQKKGASQKRNHAGKRPLHGGEVDSNGRGSRGKPVPADDVIGDDFGNFEVLSPPDARGMGQSTGCHTQLSAQQLRSRSLASVAQWNQAINASVRAGNHEKAEKLLHEIYDAGLMPDTISYNSVIHACAKQGDITRAELWLLKMRDRGVNPNTISYNILMDACVKADDAEAAERWLARMIEDGVSPNEVSYATLIHASAKHGATEHAEQWLQRMLNEGVEPNIVSYNSLIYACGRQGDVEGAEKWVNEVEKRGLSARVTTYTAVVDACAKAGDVLRAEKWMEKMIAAEVEPNVVSYSAMIDACSKAGDPARAELWHKRMLEKGVQPNAHTFSAVISACAKGGNVAAAGQHLKRMEEANIPADVVVYSSVLDACAKAGDSDSAMQIFQQMRAHEIRPNVVAYASLARPFAHRGDWAEVERLAQMMSDEGLTMNEYFLYALLLAYASARPRQAERAAKAFLDARAKGIEANKHVVAALGRAVGRVRCNQLMAPQSTPSQQGTAERVLQQSHDGSAWSGSRSGKPSHQSKKAGARQCVTAGHSNS